MLIVLGSVAVLTVLAGILVFNGLARSRASVDECWRAIQAELAARQQILPNLMGLLKSYPEHEQELLETIRQAQIQPAEQNNAESAGQAESKLSQLLAVVFTKAQKYPELKSNPDFVELCRHIPQLEDRIDRAAREYNTAVRSHNARLGKLPYSVLSSSCGFEKETPFRMTYSTERKPLA